MSVNIPYMDAMGNMKRLNQPSQSSFRKNLIQMNHTHNALFFGGDLYLTNGHSFILLTSRVYLQTTKGFIV